jgi:hypothetical protein
MLLHVLLLRCLQQQQVLPWQAQTRLQLTLQQTPHLNPDASCHVTSAAE